MQLIVGLGNVGKKYNKTRHNFGFMLADLLHDNYNFNNWQSKFDGEIAKGKIEGYDCLILKPHTFMNLSGLSVMKVMSFYKIKPEKLTILHDDIDIDIGRIKIKVGGGNGGHNGLKSIDKAIGSNYKRLRLGVGRSKVENIDSANHVLGKFDNDEIMLVDYVNKKISNLFLLILKDENIDFMNKFYL